ncbi:MAG: Nucleoid-associated protein YaaK [uncultured Thermomicrobiales bacterium]|jgi:DNA-binding YbaB/EbfC family protein|uniref:Nucleoid-associated protein AVDCRST_MAG18-2360 n=1 Tax=uncultured Thermomicrobiales bacterium TaxID=1645740 RepID=A0A6J4VI28_9BACT|nr:MAG: Nucleoid-associated protein YaaK [uncultured Thermomicrobiales bacterium]
MQPNMRAMQQMQTRMAKIQEELGQTTVTGNAGGDAVTVEVTGLKELKAIKLSPEVVDPEDVETLEDLLVVAVKQAMDKAEELAGQKFGALTGGMKIPGLF